MTRAIYILSFILFAFAQYSYGQKEVREYVRKGNKFFNDSSYVDSEINYRKALEKDPSSTIAKYNLGTDLMYQKKVDEALKEYSEAAEMTKDKKALANIYHNIGVLNHTKKEYGKAVEAYKNALINNPKDDETRYNLILAQKMLKQQQQQQKKNDKDGKDKKDKKDQQNKDKNKKPQKDKKDKDQKQQQQQQNRDKISKKNAEQLLKAVMQGEKKTKEKLKKQKINKGGSLEKDW